MKQLAEAITDGGLRAINFFNGRLLTGEDLTTERQGNRDLSRRLGKAVGPGVAYGLEVAETAGTSTPAQPVVTVAPGSAVTRTGQPLELKVATDIALTQPASTTPTPAATGFAMCEPPQTAIVAPTGVYLLLISPSRSALDSVPVSALTNVIAPCNTRYIVEGVQLRLVQLPLSLADLQQGNLLRNDVAYKCYSPADPAYQQALADPFNSTPHEYGLLGQLRTSAVLSDCDVPLAVFSWTTAGGLQFIDLWSVRRRVTHPGPGGSWGAIVSDHRAREAEARLLQFQDQILQMANAPAPAVAPGKVVATDYFRYLPAAGMLPAGGVTAAPGFDYRAFFGGLPLRGPVFIEGAAFETLLRASLAYEPIDLTSGELVSLYLVRQNIQTIDQAGPNPPRPFVVFASGDIPDQCDTRFDVSRWNYSNFM